jgi:signal transduction histidine kinase/predicted CoA-binding protein
LRSNLKAVSLRAFFAKQSQGRVIASVFCEAISMYDFLKKLPLFADLPQADLDRICEMVEEVYLPAGAELFAEGSPGDRAYIIKEGQIEILKFSGGREVLLAVRQPGEVIGEMSLLEASTRNASGRARVDSVLLAITHEQLNELLNTSTSAARAVLHTVTSRLRATEIMLRQSEKMAQLGTLTAGIAHELNNPAAAAQRGAEQLSSALRNFQDSLVRLNELDLSEDGFTVIQSLEKLTQERASMPPELNALERSDQEYEVENWLENKDIASAWEYAPTLVNLGFETSGLEELSRSFREPEFAALLDWLTASFTIYSLLEEIRQGAGQISNIVRSLKTYVYLDQAPVQEVDVHEGLDNTLVMLRSKLKSGLTLRREYAGQLPRIQAYGSELNQVWTNIIDNAIDAMGNQGDLVLRTRLEGDWVVVEIQDSGPGIPEEIQSKIFNPFFTTKPVGKGTGLGLNISYNIILKHGGEIKLFSKPGQTCFQVWLPINFKKVQSSSRPVSTIYRPSDREIHDILENSRTIAVVGITNHRDRPGYSVPAYLQSHGYRIIPVNPRLDAVLGEKVYPDLKSVPEPVDVVLIFRKSDKVQPIVDEAIQIGAKVIWMQEGIVNETAAAAAQDAGIQVIMDACMRAQHIRLIGNR